MKPRPHLFLLVAVLVLLGTADSSAQRGRSANVGPVSKRATVPTPARITPDARRRSEAFNKVWTVLAENYFDVTFNKLDWNRVKSEYEPKVRAARSDAELHGLLAQMISRLGRSHLAIIPPEVYRAIESAKVEVKVREARRDAGKDGPESANSEPDDEKPPELMTQFGIGVDLRIISGQFVITKIAPSSAAEKAGLRLGYAIHKINGVSLPSLLDRLESSGAATPPLRRQLIYQVITGFLNGDEGTEVIVTVADEKGVNRDFAIKRERLDTQIISIMSSVPERFLKFENRSIAEDIGYIHFDYFAVPVIDQFCLAIGEFRAKSGLVLDLRDNHGGLLATLPALAGMLSQEKIDMGTSIFRTSTESMTAWPKAKNFKGKIVVLIDGHTTSAAEIFAAGLQESGRAFVVGERSPGEALPSVTVELSTGAVLQYPIANFKTSTGKFLEGTGVVPDYMIPLSKASLLSGTDEQLKTAVELLRGDRRPTRRDNGGEPVEPELLGPLSSPPVPPPAPGIPRPDARSTADAERSTSSAEKAIEPEAQRAIQEFLDKIGGREAISRIRSYSMTGEIELSVKGTQNSLRIDVYRDGPSKYAEILSSPSAGEIREVHNGKTITIQADYGLTRELPKYTDVVETDILGPIRALADPGYFASLKYHGVFDRGGRKAHHVDGRSRDGMMVALAFDASTGLLINFTGAYYGMNFDAYEKAGDLILPHIIERERIMTISVDKIMINEPIEPSRFLKRDMCFDKEN